MEDVGLAAKRPRTPLPDPPEKVGTLERLRAWVWKLFKSVMTIVIVTSAMFSFVLCYTFYKNYQCSHHKSLTINATLVMEELTRNVIGQELGVREIMKGLTKFSFSTSGDEGPSALLLLLFGWVGVGKVSIMSHEF